MGDFKFASAAFAGFELLRRRPVVMLGLCLVGTLISFGGRIAVIAGNHFKIFKGASAFATGMFSTILMAITLGGTIALIGAAIARPAVRSDGRRPELRLGGDAARLFLLTLLVFPSALIVLAGLAVGAAVGVAARAASTVQDTVMSTAAVVGMIVVFGLASRLWPAGAMSVQAGGMRLRAAWRITGKRPWKIFATFCLATAMALLVGVGGNTGLNAVVAKLPAMQWTSYLPLVAALKSGFGPLQLGQLLAQGLLFGLAIVLQIAPAPVILGALAEDHASDQAAVFD